MIRAVVDFALNNRLFILAGALLLFIWGAISFKNLPIEAYPDVANNYVQIITQWPGRAAEEIEQQVTIPLEIVMNGVPHLTHLRSASLFGLSSLMLVFDDEAENDWNRAKVLERLAQVTDSDSACGLFCHGCSLDRAARKSRDGTRRSVARGVVLLILRLAHQCSRETDFGRLFGEDRREPSGIRHDRRFECVAARLHLLPGTFLTELDRIVGHQGKG